MKKLVNKFTVSMVLSTLIFASDEVILLDTSGSLNTPSTVTEISRLTQENLKRGKEIIAFSDDAYRVKKVSDLKFGGGTATSKGLKAVLNTNYRYVVIVTDGESNDNKETIKQAKLLKAKSVKICSVFLTSNGSSIPETLSEISDRVFLSTNVAGAFAMCSDSEVKRQLLGQSAVKKIVDTTHFNLF